MAIGHAPKAAAQAAFKMIKAMTPDLTAFPMFGPIGFLIALNNGIMIIAPKAPKKTIVISIGAWLITAK